MFIEGKQRNIYPIFVFDDELLVLITNIDFYLILVLPSLDLEHIVENQNGLVSAKENII